MKTIKKYPSMDFLLSIFSYKNGKLYWKVKKTLGIKIGDEAGRKHTKGYFRVCVDGIDYMRSR